MKRLLTGILFIFALTVQGYSLNLDIGARGSFGFGTHSNDGVTEGSIFHAGIGPVAELMIFDFLSVDLAVTYQDKGARYQSGAAEQGYLEIPLMVKLYFYEGFWVGAGWHFDFLVLSNHAFQRNFSTFDTGFLVGLGAKFPLNKGKTMFITVDFKADHGLFDVLPGFQGDQLNRTYMIQFGAMFRLF